MSNLKQLENDKQLIQLAEKDSSYKLEYLEEIKAELESANNQLYYKNAGDVNEALRDLKNTLSDALCTEYGVKYTSNIFNTLTAVQNMLTHVLNYNATRLALCNCIENVLHELTFEIEKTLAEVEKENEICKARKIITSFYKLTDDELYSLSQMFKKVCKE